MTNDDDRRGPAGKAAIDEIGERLKELFGGVFGAFQAKGGTDAAEGRVETEKGPIKTEMGWKVTLGGMELSGSNLDELREKAPYRPGRHPGARRARAGASAGRRPLREKSEPDAAPAPRAAHVEVFDELDAVIVTAELPGVAADDVSLDLSGLTLAITAAGARPFAATAALPEGADPTATPEMRLANGVLEVRIPKRAAV